MSFYGSKIIGADGARTVWTIDPQYATVEFSVKPLFLTVKGRSTDLSGKITLDVTMTDRSRSPQGDEIIYCAAVAEIDRLDFGIKYARWLIGRAIKILIQVQAVKRR